MSEPARITLSWGKTLVSESGVPRKKQEESPTCQTSFTQNHLLRTPFLPPRMIFIFIYLFLSLFIFVWMWSVYGIIVCGCVHTWRLSWHKVSFSMFLDFSFWDGALSEPETSPAKLDGRKSSSNLTTPTLGEPWANVTMPSFKVGTGESKLGVTELLEWQALYQQSPLIFFIILKQDIIL